MGLKIYWKEPGAAAALLHCYTLGILKKIGLRMRQRASNLSDMLITYSMYARNRSAE